ncbi:MAG: SRPBCC domain-containing protein [Tepidisphaeraceae bacterium]
MVAPNRTEAPPANRVLVITRTFDAPRALVFKAWTHPERLARWWGPKDFTLPYCEVEFAVGGGYRFCMRAPDGADHWVWGTYQEIDEPQRLAFTWHREDAEGNLTNESLVTVTLAEHDGKTTLTLHQAVFKTVDDRDAHRGGWTECLERLGAYVAKA